MPKKLEKIKSSAFSRGFALAKVSMGAGARAASHAVGNIFAADEDKPDRLRNMLLSQVQALTNELGQLKGSVMKVGQMLSMFGEQFLPPEVNSILKKLQSESQPLQWPAIEKVLKRQLSPEQLAQVEVDPEPMASASLGQVHRATLKATGRSLAMKIQYPGVDQAIESDLRAMKSILSVSKLIPKGPKYDEIFAEVRTMLHQEVDYARELKATQEIKRILGGDLRYIVPEVFPELSTKRVLTTSLEEGIPIDSAQLKALSQERRNRLALSLYDLYLRELFELHSVQTDPHFGNYRIRLSDDHQDQWILYDYGAVRKLSASFVEGYGQMVRGSYRHNRDDVFSGAEKIGFLKPDDSDELKRRFFDLCVAICEPFQPKGTPGIPAELFDENGDYIWSKSDLPLRLVSKGKDLAFSTKLRTPPKELVFLDRKMGGIFILMSSLDARVQTRPLLDRYLGN